MVDEVERPGERYDGMFTLLPLAWFLMGCFWLVVLFWCFVVTVVLDLRRTQGRPWRTPTLAVGLVCAWFISSGWILPEVFVLQPLRFMFMLPFVMFGGSLD